MLGQLLVDDHSSSRCSCTKDWYSALHASTSLPLVHTFSQSPSTSLLKRWKGTKASPPIQIAGQKQLIHCPVGDLEATVESIQFTNSSRKRRASHEIQSASTGSQLCPAHSKRECQKESLSHQSQETANDLESHISAIDVQMATKKPPLFFAASSKVKRASSSKEWYTRSAAVNE